MDSATTTTEPFSPLEQASKAAEAVALRPGDIVDDCYVIEQTLGVGGMGHVYAAFEWALNRRVAIKVARWRSGNDALTREARIMASFRHRGLPAIYATGEHDGHAFLVMEYLGGMTLAEHMRRGARFSIDEAGALLCAICENLRALHHAGLAHRDLKPSNVMLAPDGRVVLVDFGICAREHNESSTIIAGSPHYMAPEIALARVKPGQGHLVDLYALGVLGFVLLCGRKPFVGRNVVEVLDRQMRETAPSAREYRPDVPAPLAELLARLLARDAEDRPTCIDAVADQLARYNSRPMWMFGPHEPAMSGGKVAA